MRMKHTMMILTMSVLLLLGMTISVSAESQTVNGHCWFDGGSTIESDDFDSNTIATKVRGLEPGDDVTFRVEFKNKYKDTTYWYMKSQVMKTLEQSFDRSENGGYTFKLTHIKPNGDRQVLFSNEQVGGDAKVAGMEGLHQATNATKEWFFIQKLAVALGISDERTVNLTQKHIRGRLAESILFLKESYGLEEDGCTLSIYLSREDMANLSNMTTSNAIRTLSTFAQEKIIAIDGRKIKIMNEPELEKISKFG